MGQGVKGAAPLGKRVAGVAVARQGQAGALPESPRKSQASLPRDGHLAMVLPAFAEQNARFGVLVFTKGLSFSQILSLSLWPRGVNSVPEEGAGLLALPGASLRYCRLWWDDVGVATCL